MFNLKFACISSLIVQLLVYNICVLSLHNCLEIASLRNMLWSEEKKTMVGLAVGCLAYTSSGESLF